jgi:hypothetical protein
VTISSEGQGFMYVSDYQGQDPMFHILGAFIQPACKQGMLSAGAVAGWFLSRRSHGK